MSAFGSLNDGRGDVHWRNGVVGVHIAPSLELSLSSVLSFLSSVICFIYNIGLVIKSKKEGGVLVTRYYIVHTRRSLCLVTRLLWASY